MNGFIVKRNLCPVCNSSIFEVLYSVNYYEDGIKNFLSEFYRMQGGIDYSYLNDAVFVICQCSECSLIFQQFIPNDELMQILYEKWIDPAINYDYHLKNDDLGLYSDYALEIMRVISTINKVPSELSFLDFGMGWAKWILMAKAFGVNSYGIEYSSNKKSYAEDIGIKTMQLDNLPAKYFDFINTEQVFEHIENPCETLETLTESLKNGGIIKISVPNGNNFKKKYFPLNWNKTRFEKYSPHIISPLEHINLFTTKSLLKLTEKTGLQPFYIPLRKQYKYSIILRPLFPMIETLLLPLKRNILKTETYMFFIKE
jgi:cyclopropane fatty-acyl-phospholipid synthase-like methyltransferase